MMIKKVIVVVATSLLLWACQNNQQTETGTQANTSSSNNEVKGVGTDEDSSVRKNEIAQQPSANKDSQSVALPTANKKPEAPQQPETKPVELAYTIMKNYFVKNTVTTIADPKIETAERFNEIFGMARTMGEKGKPTAIDFSKQYVIAVILPETDSFTTVTPISLQKKANKEIVLNYRSTVGEKKTYRMSPFFGIIVDKKENGLVKLNKL